MDPLRAFCVGHYWACLERIRFSAGFLLLPFREADSLFAFPLEVAHRRHSCRPSDQSGAQFRISPACPPFFAVSHMDSVGPRGLTNRWSQPLVGLMTRVNFMKQCSMLRKLAP